MSHHDLLVVEVAGKSNDGQLLFKIDGHITSNWFEHLTDVVMQNGDPTPMPVVRVSPTSGDIPLGSLMLLEGDRFAIQVQVDEDEQDPE